MIVEFDKSFLKSLDKIKDVYFLKRVEKIILEFERVGSINELNNTNTLSGFKTSYRTRIGDYRLGFELINSKTIRLIIITHRKDIYRIFP